MVSVVYSTFNITNIVFPLMHCISGANQENIILDAFKVDIYDDAEIIGSPITFISIYTYSLTP
jgi:hypothetical protein